MPYTKIGPERLQPGHKGDLSYLVGKKVRVRVVQVRKGRGREARCSVLHVMVCTCLSGTAFRIASGTRTGYALATTMLKVACLGCGVPGVPLPEVPDCMAIEQLLKFVLGLSAQVCWAW